MKNKYARKCDQCSIGINEGFKDVDKTYCSEKCLIEGNKQEMNNPLFDMNDWELHTRDNPNDCYYTEWEEIDQDDFYNKNGVNFKTDYEFKLYNRLYETHQIIKNITDLKVEEITSDNFLTLKGTLVPNEILL